MEDNPLNLTIPSPNKIGINKTGRPTKENITFYSPQPTSIVSKLLIALCKKSKSARTNDNYFTRLTKSEKSQSKCTEQKLNENLKHPSVDSSVPVFNNVKCSLCSHRSANKKENAQHLLTHKKNGKYICHYESCNFSASHISNIIKHLRTHTAEKPFLCDKCTFRSNFINSLKAHRRIHSLEKPYVCNSCNYKCNSSSNLKKHIRHRHSNL